jgi:NitT/TauT family transport system substrate-binding protein
MHAESRRFMKRAAFVSATAAAAILPHVARAADPPIRFAASTAETFCLPLVAQELGYFTSAGLSVEITLINGGAANTTAVIGHVVDVGTTNTGTFCNSHPRGIPLTIIAAGALYLSSAPTTVLVVAKTSSINTAADLKGKTIALPTLGESAEAGLMKWIDVTGGSSAATKFTEIPSVQMVAAVNDGRVDAALLQEPFLAAGKSSVRKIAQPYDVVAPRFLNTAYFSQDDWIAQNPATAAKLAAVLRRSAVWANNNDTAIVPILAKYSKMDPAVIAQVTRARHGESLQPALIQPVIDVMAQYKFSPARFPAADIVWMPKA